MPCDPPGSAYAMYEDQSLSSFDLPRPLHTKHLRPMNVASAITAVCVHCQHTRSRDVTERSALACIHSIMEL